jgi:hypothetical protein
VPDWAAAAAYTFVAGATVALLVLHTLRVAGIQIDTTTLGLLALLLLLPLAPHITRLKAGGLEAEIGPREARQLQASAADLPAATAAVDQTSADASTIYDLIERDPPLGLAKLRIELEDELLRLCAIHVPDAKLRELPPGLMAHELREKGVLPREIAEPLADVTALANRAVHGEYVPAEVASDIANVGVRVLSALRTIS